MGDKHYNFGGVNGPVQTGDGVRYAAGRDQYLAQGDQHVAGRDQVMHGGASHERERGCQDQARRPGSCNGGLWPRDW